MADMEGVVNNGVLKGASPAAGKLKPNVIQSFPTELDSVLGSPVTVKMGCNSCFKQTAAKIGQ